MPDFFISFHSTFFFFFCTFLIIIFENQLIFKVRRMRNGFFLLSCEGFSVTRYFWIVFFLICWRWLRMRCVCDFFFIVLMEFKDWAVVGPWLSKIDCLSRLLWRKYILAGFLRKLENIFKKFLLENLNFFREDLREFD